MKSPSKPASKPSAFLEAVRAAVLAIPEGSTRSYAQVALMANRPGAMRAVVRALRALKGIPWWRVHRSDGTLAEQVAVEQARRLKREGISVHPFGREGTKLRVQWVSEPRTSGSGRRARALAPRRKPG